MNDQRGSASLVMASALGLAAILSALSADVARMTTARARSQTAADAAALAAAQELIVPSSTAPSAAADEYAGRHGAMLTDCQCAPGSDEAVVTVSLKVTLPFSGGERVVSAQARAVVEPSEMAGLNPVFAARLSCLLEAVPGLSIVSGFRTQAEQAALYEEKPNLAAPPGHSLHELGLAADLGFPSDGARRRAHASAHGCGLEFPVSYEPWHVEPIGISS